MEKEILEVLKAMQSDLKSMQSDIKGLKEGQERIEKKLDGVVEQTADLTEFRTLVKNNLEELKAVEKVTKENCYEIAKIKSIK